MGVHSAVLGRSQCRDFRFAATGGTFYARQRNVTLRPLDIALGQKSDRKQPILVNGEVFTETEVLPLYEDIQKPDGTIQKFSAVRYEHWPPKELKKLQSEIAKICKNPSSKIKKCVDKKEAVHVQHMFPSAVRDKFIRGFSTDLSEDRNSEHRLDAAIKSALVNGIGVFKNFATEQDCLEFGRCTNVYVQGKPKAEAVLQLGSIYYDGDIPTKASLDPVNTRQSVSKNEDLLADQYRRLKQQDQKWVGEIKASFARVTSRWGPLHSMHRADVEYSHSQSVTLYSIVEAQTGKQSSWNPHASTQPYHSDNAFKLQSFSALVFVDCEDYCILFCSDQTNFQILSSPEAQEFFAMGGAIAEGSSKLGQFGATMNDIVSKLVIIPPSTPAVQISTAGYVPQTSDLVIFNSHMVHAGTNQPHILHFIGIWARPLGLSSKKWNAILRKESRHHRDIEAETSGQKRARKKQKRQVARM